MGPSFQGLVGMSPISGRLGGEAGFGSVNRWLTVKLRERKRVTSDSQIERGSMCDEYPLNSLELCAPIFYVQYAACGPPFRPTQHRGIKYPRKGTERRSWQRTEASQGRERRATTVDWGHIPSGAAQPELQRVLAAPPPSLLERAAGMPRLTAFISAWSARNPK